MKPIIISAITLIATALSASGADDKDMADYLMVYFSDSDHSLHFAISDDGHSFTALNCNKGQRKARRHMHDNDAYAARLF